MNEVVQSSLARAYTDHRAGRLAEAERSYRRVLAADAQHPEANHLLGVVCLQQGDALEALKHLQVAQKYRDGHVDLHLSLSQAWLSAGDPAAAERSARRALELRPDNVSAMGLLGNALRGAGRQGEAISAYRRVLDREPNHPESRANLGALLWDSGDKSGAMEQWRAAVQLQPENADLHFYLARGLADAGLFRAASAGYQRSLDLRPGLLASLNGLGVCYRELGDGQKSIECLQAVHRADPEFFDAVKNLGLSYQACGDRSAALATFSSLVKQKPGAAEVWYLAALASDAESVSDILAGVDNQLAKDTTSQVDRVYLHFARARLLERSEQVESALENLTMGHRLKAELNPYSEAPFKELVQTICANEADAWAPATVSDPPTQPRVPIFVVGMPRSGTTLATQILSTHSTIDATGEWRAMGRVVSALERSSRMPWPEAATSLSSGQAAAWAKSYLSEVTGLAGVSGGLVDKLPANYLYTGLIFKLFPHARVVYCHRHPADNCLSIFRQLFVDHHGYADDLTVLGRHYRLHQRLMGYWSECFGSRIYHLQYEELVTNPEQQIRGLLAFCGLDFESNCLHFHQHVDTVNTASAYQVRRPMNQDSVGVWRRYGEGLQPLLNALQLHD